MSPSSTSDSPVSDTLPSPEPALAVEAGCTIHSLPLAAVYQALATCPQGLPQSEAAHRRRGFGANRIEEIPRSPIILRLLANFTHLMAILLWLGGAIAFIAGMPELGIAIWLVNLINGAFSFWQEYKAERAIEALRQLLPTHVRVLREGQERSILAEDLVPGDLMLLSEGEHISADGRLIEENELRVDQSTLTGESHPVRKTAEMVLRTDLARAEIVNLVFAGTSVAIGSGKAIVFATGMHTEFGKIAHLTQSLEDGLSPLQQEINTITKMVSMVAIGMGVLFFILALAMGIMNWAEGLIFAMGMIVAFVPEGLLPTVTLALAMGVQRMARRNALVKRLSSVETLGCTTVICTDKTGTLTQNEMTVRELWVAGRSCTVTGVGYHPTGQILSGGQPVNGQEDADLQQLLVAADLCNNAHLLPPDEQNQHWHILGDPTEAALHVLARKGGVDLEAMARQEPRLRELPFDSRRKRMSTIHQASLDRVVYVKGAPRETLSLCTHIWQNGAAHPLRGEQHAQILAINDGYARQGLRVLAIAQRTLPNEVTGYAFESIERELTFLGLVAMMDPPRPEVSEAVEKCHGAGIRIIMMTGDYGLTAESIARRVGIIKGPQPRIITGAELDLMETPALITALNDEVIFARVTPEHKLKVVSALQEAGQIVAVTGDGVNDAPALKKADIGVAMGVAGTDVAKEAADMILIDDNFASIVNAVEEGRAVYANIKKFTSYIFTSNTPEAVPFILFAFSAGRIPLALTIMQILAVDLGTDLVPALALGTEPPEPDVMDRPPRSLHEHVITWPLLARAYLWLGPVQSLAAMAAFYYQYWTHGYWGQWLDLPDAGMLYASATAMTLAAVVTTQIGNLFAQRTERISVFQIGLFSNRLAWLGIATELLLIVLLVYVPFLHPTFDTAAFPVSNWVFLFAWTPALLFMDEMRKFLWRRRRHTHRQLAGGVA